LREQYITATYRIIVTDEKWLKGITEASGGSTAYEQKMSKPVWSKELHSRYFPKTFRLRVKILLMMRLPRHAGNFIFNLPKEIFMHVIEHLAVVSYEENTIPAWEPNVRESPKRAIPEETVRAYLKLKNQEPASNSCCSY